MCKMATNDVTYLWNNTAGHDKIYGIMRRGSGCVACYGRRGKTIKLIDYPSKSVYEVMNTRNSHDYENITNDPSPTCASIRRQIDNTFGIVNSDHRPAPTVQQIVDSWKGKKNAVYVSKDQSDGFETNVPYQVLNYDEKTVIVIDMFGNERRMEKIYFKPA